MAYSVLVFDMSRTGEPDGKRVVDGFDSLQAAEAYARARVRASIEELRKSGIAPEELYSLWCLYGEDCSVIGGPFKGRENIFEYIANPASETEIDWPSHRPG